MKPYSESIFSYLGIYFILFTNMLSMLFYKKETDKKSIFLYNLAYFAALLRILFYGIPILGRVYLLFSVFEFFIPYVDAYVKEISLSERKIFTQNARAILENS